VGFKKGLEKHKETCGCNLELFSSVEPEDLLLMKGALSPDATLSLRSYF